MLENVSGEDSVAEEVDGNLPDVSSSSESSLSVDKAPTSKRPRKRSPQPQPHAINQHHRSTPHYQRHASPESSSGPYSHSHPNPSSSVSRDPNRSVHPARLKRKAKQEAALLSSSSEPQGHGAEDTAARVRELMKEAYSPASLHTFKSDPLRKRGHGSQHSSHTNDGRGRGRGSVGRGGGGGMARGRGRGAGVVVGRGQPDMRKRMGALLAQIEAQK